ncbi:UNVERIFIED_CONTAM: hypothetical protein Sradi_5366800 [Sesamum radiatum]|uniref:Uncharacterized protein n=1 Tax=Sesamum radiatum TaxID=300843 RepID=A0AAW2LRT8_SESRA
MAVEKVTPMVLKVDLQCPCCYKKIKKTLCKFPQIRDQVYDEKNNTVAITVVCCSPEKIRDKLCCKGGKVIKSIEIIEPPKPKKKKDADKPKEPEKPEKPRVVVVDKPKEPEKPKVVVVENPEKPPKEAEKPKSNGKADKPKSNGKGDKPKPDGEKPAEAPKAEKPAEKPKEAPKPEAAANPEPAAKAPPPAEPVKGPEPVPVNGVPSVFPYCGPTYDAYAAGPYYHGYGFPPPPQPCYEGYNGYGQGYGHGYGRVGYASRSDGYFSEENPQGCSIM